MFGTPGAPIQSSVTLQLPDTHRKIHALLKNKATLLQGAQDDVLERKGLQPRWSSAWDGVQRSSAVLSPSRDRLEGSNLVLSSQGSSGLQPPLLAGWEKARDEYGRWFCVACWRYHELCAQPLYTRLFLIGTVTSFFGNANSVRCPCIANNIVRHYVFRLPHFLVLSKNARLVHPSGGDIC